MAEAEDYLKKALDLFRQAENEADPERRAVPENLAETYRKRGAEAQRKNSTHA
jgi:hypothetical protein